jgi:multiple sugar transport system substrate-binding protein
MRVVHLFLIAIVMIATSCARVERISVLMENVPDTRYIEEILPEFTEETGIEVEFEIVNYAEMHPKLIPQLVASSGSYDAIVVDFYWVGQFTKAGWLRPLDDLIKRDGFDTSVYVPSVMNLVGKVEAVTYMLPFYNYAMGLTYRRDLLEDPKNKKEFDAKYGMPLRVPQTWNEYKKQVEFFARDTDGDGTVDFYGVVNQGLRPDPIVMEWSNYLFANGGRFHDENWRPRISSPEAREALQDYIRNIKGFGPLGAASFGFDEAFNVAAQGKAYSYITYGYFRRSFDDPTQSAVVGKIEIAPVPNGGLNGAWGWAIPESSPNPEGAWKFLKWVESFKIAKRRAAMGGGPTRFDVFDDPDLNARYPYLQTLKVVLATSHNFPVFTYTPELIEVLGRELSLAVTGKKDAAAALKTVDRQFEDLARKDGKLK